MNIFKIGIPTITDNYGTNKAPKNLKINTPTKLSGYIWLMTSPLYIKHAESLKLNSIESLFDKFSRIHTSYSMMIRVEGNFTSLQLVKLNSLLKYKKHFIVTKLVPNLSEYVLYEYNNLIDISSFNEVIFSFCRSTHDVSQLIFDIQFIDALLYFCASPEWSSIGSFRDGTVLEKFNKFIVKYKRYYNNVYDRYAICYNIKSKNSEIKVK